MFNFRALVLVLSTLSCSVLIAKEESPILIQNMRTGLKEISQAIIAAAKNDPVSFGQISSGVPGSNFGTGLVDLISSDIEREKSGIIRVDAPVIVTATYFLEREPKPAINLKFALTRTNGDNVSSFAAKLTGNTDVAAVVGATAVLSPEGDAEVRATELAKQLEKPLTHQDGNIVRASSTSKLGVEIRTKPVGSTSAATPRFPRIEKGQAFVPIAQGEVYEIVIHNDDKREIAATIAIDGLSVFAFSEVRNSKTGGPAYSKYIIAAGQTQVIPGWHFRDKGADNYASFLVTEYGKGASVKAPQSAQGNTGVITVSFSYTSPEGKGRGGSETGFGPPRTVDVKPVKRAIDPPHEFVTIRYAR